MKKLFYIRAMKGINNKINILCRTVTSKNSIIVVQSYLKKTMTSSLLRNHNFQRNNPRIHFILKNERSHHEPAYHNHRYYNLLTFPNTAYHNRAMTQYCYNQEARGLITSQLVQQSYKSSE